jgi:hypothetical protein
VFGGLAVNVIGTPVPSPSLESVRAYAARWQHELAARRRS